MSNNVDILRYNDEGLGIAKIEDMTIFVDNALVGEKINIEIIEKKKNYCIAKNKEIIISSNNREKPRCPYYNQCGGCNIMHMSYSEQLNFKTNKVKNILRKMCNIDVNPLIEYDSQFNYRNKITLKLKENLLGFYSKNTHDIVDINECFISDSKINKIIKKLKEYIISNKDHNISETMIRASNKVLISIDKINIKLKNNFIEYMCKYVDIIYINNKKEYGTNQIINLNNINYIVSNNSFFQVNNNISEKMYKYVYDNIKSKINAIDLYCGVGTITSIIASKCNKVIGVELVKSAIESANENIKLNNINNVEFICSKVENIIDKIKLNNIELVILDPPRSGSDKKTINTIKNIKPKNIIYISCNPITLARDLNNLLDLYEIQKIKLFDMFPNTYHVETICILTRKAL